MSTARFRHDYLDHAALTAQLRAWADEHPDLVRLDVLCTTPEGREQWLLTIGRDPDRARPSAWVNGNMHASELTGSSVALAIAEDVLALHTRPDAAMHDLPAHVRDRLRDVVFRIVPRVSPDGAEAVLTTGRYVRSVPRDARSHRLHPRWIGGDIDGDGLALVMRREDPNGEFVESRSVPGLMLVRELEDEGPFYKLWPEGLVENFDGERIPDPSFLCDNDADLNRQFPWHWTPEPEQVGAGRFPLSEPEARAIAEWAVAHPELFVWLDLHTFGGCFIRPRGDAPDTDMDPADLAIYRQLGAWADAHVGYPMVSGFEEFTYEPKTPVRGDLIEWAWAQRGCVSAVCELWDVFARAGLPRPKRFVDAYTHQSRADLERIGAWLRENTGDEVLRPWKRVDHPQLGPVEVGGLDIRFGLSNPPRSLLPEVCAKLSAWFLRVAAMVPRPEITELAVEPLGDGVWALRGAVENRGYLPTYGLSSARKLPWNEGLWLEADVSGARLDGESRVALGHLDGWGRGRFDGTGALYYMRSRGNGHRATFRLVGRGAGRVRLKIGSSRVGYVERDVTVG